MGSHLKNISLYIATGHWLSLAQKNVKNMKNGVWLNLKKNYNNRIQIISLGIKGDGGEHDWGITMMTYYVWTNPELYTLIENIYGVVFRRSVCKW